jgi:hypothetical protein
MALRASGLPQGKVTGYYEAVVHGDLHPDNILLTASDRTYLIDFSHTQEQHAALDYIVMEAMVRSYLLRQCLEKILVTQESKHLLNRAALQWVDIEGAIYMEDWTRAMQIPQKESWGAEYIKLTSVIRWLRESAKRKNFLEPLEFYHAGLGMTCYSFVGLPDESEVREVSREALLIAAALSFSKCLGGSLKKPDMLLPLEMAQLDESLAGIAAAWRGWILRKARGHLEKVKGTILDSVEAREAILANAKVAVESVRTKLPLMHTFFSELVRKLKLNSVAGDVGQEAIQLMALKLKDATWRIWEYA